MRKSEKIEETSKAARAVLAALFFCCGALGTLASVPADAAEETGLIEPGQITAALSASFPPIASVDSSGNFVGIDPDIIRAIGDQLGLKVNFVNIKTDGLIPGVNSKRFDVAMAGLTDTKKREQAVDFVNYANVGSAFIVQAGNPKKITNLDSICGLTVASDTGDVATFYAREQSEKCVKEGKPPVTVHEFTESAQAMLQLEQGRADVIMHDYSLSAYLVKQTGGKLEIVGNQFNVAPYGIVIYKGNVALRKLLMKGLDEIIANGKYAQILKKYNISDAALTKATFNQPVK